MKNAIRSNGWVQAGALCILLVFASPSFAQTDVQEPPSAPLAPTGPAAAPASTPSMGIAQVIEHLVSRGYSDIREVERKSDKLFEVKTRNDKGMRVELLVDARSGEVLESKRDD